MNEQLRVEKEQTNRMKTDRDYGPTPYRGYCLLMWEYEGGSTLCLLLFNVLVISLLLFLVGDGCLAITCKLLHIPLTSFGRG